MRSKDKKITIYVPEGTSGYQIELCGTRDEILKAVCNIYGGSLTMYQHAEWNELRGSETSTREET